MELKDEIGMKDRNGKTAYNYYCNNKYHNDEKIAKILKI